MCPHVLECIIAHTFRKNLYGWKADPASWKYVARVRVISGSPEARPDGNGSHAFSHTWLVFPCTLLPLSQYVPSPTLTLPAQGPCMSQGCSLLLPPISPPHNLPPSLSFSSCLLSSSFSLSPPPSPLLAPPLSALLAAPLWATSSPPVKCFRHWPAARYIFAATRYIFILTSQVNI